ncbi:intercompartmental signaling factor BofC [Bacillus marinisedimentorum]|uniref:intercompartmental signaling factor BofC n=1 Tax=Bacillus marinisedimentorum TaxID=1821260 RepID=UPI0008733511|nr:intercompartmental signaling factor BofC [Bacillus marinisedimentorum]
MRAKMNGYSIFLITLAAVILVLTFAENGPEGEVKSQDPVKVSGTENSEAYEVSGPLTVTVKLQRMYLDGEISEEVKKETILSMEDFWAQYEEWQLVDQDESMVVFRQNIDDISPLLKANGYFGLADNGILTIYEGHPKSQKAIQTFYQIDVGKLESRQQQKLLEGIPVQTKEEYVHVIETFKPYKISPES